MMLWALVASVAMAAPQQYGGRFSRVNERSPDGRSTRGTLGNSYAEFEFAPASGAGMGAACACASVTGARGEAMTFTRSSVGTCIKGDVDALNVGDMVTCAGEKPRVMPGANGSGALGLLVEGATVNEMMRSEEFDNAAWTKDLTAPTVTADQAYAPDGLLTADRIQFPAADSRVYQGALSATNPVGAIYFKGVSGSGTVYLWFTGSGGSFANATACSFSASVWKRCKIKDPGGGTSRTLAFGCQASLFGMPASCSAADVYAWGAFSEQGPAASSYIKSASSTAARSADAAYFSGSFQTNNAGSMSATFARSQSGATSESQYTELVESSSSWPPVASGIGRLSLYSPGTAGASFQCFAGNSAATLFTTGAVTRPGADEFSGWCSATTTVNGALSGTPMTPSAATSGTFYAGQYLVIGGSQASAFADGVVKKVCRSYDPSRCR